MADERGHLKVFIGMAPGVGKTYRMLQEGASEAREGRDVVVGYLEPHGRAETVAQADSLEIVPRRTRFLAQSGRVVNEDSAAVRFPDCGDGIAREAGFGAGQRTFCSKEAIEKT